MNRTSAALAVLLSFVFPGLGHAYLGRRRQAIVFALPALLTGLAITLQVIAGVDHVLGYLVTPTGSMTTLVLVVLAGVWRIIAMADVLIQSRRSRGRMPAPVATLAVVLLALVVGMHGYAGYIAYSVYGAGSRIFVDRGPDGSPSQQLGNAGTSPGAVPSDDEYVATPEVTPATAESRINILLTGVDSAEGRSTSLTDTLLVVSIDPAARAVTMLSIPRDIANFPLYDGRTFTGKINGLMTWVRNHPKEFPLGPFPTLIKQVGYLIGVPIHYYAAIDLEGFRRVIDEVGGVTVNNPKAINDPRYGWLDGGTGFFLKAGKVKLDGRTALAYARSRQGVGDSDFTRAARQQQLLVALRDKLASPAQLPKLPAIIDVAGDTVRTNLPTERFDEFIALAREVDSKQIDRYVLGPPYAYHPDSKTTDGIYTLRFRMDRLAKLSVDLFGSESRYAAQ